MSNLIGKQLGDYTLVGVLATGGMARIYEGLDRRLGRQAAVKVLELNPNGHDDDTNTEMLPQRFQREARAVAQLEHDHIITIYQYGEQDGFYFIAMKLIRGKDLAQELSRLRRNGLRMEVQRGLRILEQVAAALDHAHQAQIIHRDVKPSNILLDASDRATLTDFGLVMQDTYDTTLGTAFGTPRYIAPEQAIHSGSAVTQSDVYAFAIILYEVLTGQTPFDGSTPMEIALAQINDPPPPPRTINDSIPEAAEREILRALEKDPTKRQRTAGELISAVKQAYFPEDQASTALAVRTSLLPTTEPSLPTTAPLPVKRKRPIAGLIAAALGIVALVAAVLLLVLNRAPSTVSPATNMLASPSAVQSIALVEATEAATAPPIEIAAGGTAEATDPPSLLLTYDDNTFNLINDGTAAFDLMALQFAHGSNLFDGSAVPRGSLPAGTCFRIQLQRTQSSLPEGCTKLYGATYLPTTQRFFWRSEPDGSPTFEIRLNGDEIATCPTIPRGENSSCTFSLPPAA
ncbi:MAG: protein kinase [Chloroflexi bacterium]|nr:protein kinase [Chloroflexota bacterium]